MLIGPLAHQARARMWNTEGGGAGGAGSDSPGTEGDPQNTSTKTYTQADIDALEAALAGERKLKADIERSSKATAKQLKDLTDAGKPELERITGERDELATKLADLEKSYRELSSRGIVEALS